MFYSTMISILLYGAKEPYKSSAPILTPLNKKKSDSDQFSYYCYERLDDVSQISISPSLIQLFFNIIDQGDSSKLIEYIKKYPLLLASCDKYGYSALIKIFKQFDFLIIRYVVGQSIGLNMHDDADQTTPLIYAIQQQDIMLVRLLLEQKNIDVDLKDRWKRTALHYIVLLNDITIVQLLLNHKPDIFKKDCFEKTAVDYAQEHHLYDIEALLLKSLSV